MGEADQSYEYDVFISYSKADKAWVRGELLVRLKQAGLKVFRFQLGATRDKEIERAVVNSRKTLLVLTPNYVGSEWAEYEASLVQSLDPASRSQRFIPILKEDCDLPPRIKQLIPVELTEDDEDEIQIAWTQLLTACGKQPEAEQAQKSDMPKQWELVHPYGMPPHFTGRVEERQMLSDWLRGDLQHPLFVLRALGGFGKSALTWHWLIHDVEQQQWPKVVWWSFYEEKAGFDNFVYATLTYLTEQKPENLKRSERVALLLNYLRQHRILLVLDGFERALRAYGNMGAAYQGDGEQVISDAGRDCVSPDGEQFLRSLCSLPYLKGKVLMSTRLRPRSVEVTGGMLLTGCREEELTQMQSADAVQFFRLQGIRGNRGEIEQACEAYGFHPLSLRLLAGLVVKDFRNPGDIQAAQGLDVTGSLVQRQHHVLEQSYENLKEDGRKLLSQLACFRSPVEYDVLVGLADDEADLQRDLQDLIGRGVAQREQSRIDLHPIVRRYVYERMGNEDRRQTHSQLRDYFAAVPEAEHVSSIDDLAPVIELYHHMVRAGQYDEAWKLFCNRIWKTLYYQLGAYQEQIELLRALFPKGEQQLPQLQNEADQALALNELANSHSLNGQPAQAVPLFEGYMAISEKLNSKINFAIALGNLAIRYTDLGDLQLAEIYLRRRIALCQEIEDESREAVGHQNLGRLLVCRGVWTAAEAEFDRAQAMAERRQETQNLGLTWAYKALNLLMLLRVAEISKKQRIELTGNALAAAKRALELADEEARTSYPVERDYVRAYWLLGAAHRLIPNLSKSDHHLSEAIRRCRAINCVEAEADILLDLARLRRDQGNPTEALRLAEEAQRIATRCGYVLQGADIHLLLAELAREDGDLERARELAQEALRLATCDGGEYTYKVAYDEAGALLEQLGGALS